MLIDKEYEIKLSHASLLVSDHSGTSHGHTKPALPITLQTNLGHISILNHMVRRSPYY